MTTPRNSRLRKTIQEVYNQPPSAEAVIAAAAASSLAGVEAYRSVPFDRLPSDVIHQLRNDGARGELRSMEEARALYEQDVPAEAKGSLEGIRAITNDPEIEAMHIEPHTHGGAATADNIVYGPGSLNRSIGDRTMGEADIAEAEAYTAEVAEAATPGVSGDFGEVVGDTLEAGGLGGVMGGGLAVAHRLAHAQAYRDAGREDLAWMAEQEMGKDAAIGAMNGVVRGTAVAATQAILGANPLTAGIGLVAPDAVTLLTQKDSLSEEEYNQKAVEVVGKGALATMLVCAGPIGWLGLAGISIATAYGKASEHAASSSRVRGA